MTVSSIKTGYDGISLLAGNAAYDPGYFKSIATVQGDGSSQFLYFNDIPQTYTHLQIRGFAKNGGGSNLDNFYVNFNGVTSTSYSTHWIYGYGSSNASQNVANWSLTVGAFLPAGSSVDSKIGAAIVLDILDYTNTNKNTTFKALSSYNQNDSTYSGVMMASGMFQSTAAITSIRLACSNYFTANTKFALYGITS